MEKDSKIRIIAESFYCARVNNDRIWIFVFLLIEISRFRGIDDLFELCIVLSDDYHCNLYNPPGNNFSELLFQRTRSDE